MDHNHIEAYFEKVLQIKNQRRALTKAELKEIALELGMSESEWKEVQQAAKEHIDRGYNFLDHHNYDDALKELRQALIVFPTNAKALYGIAHVHEQWFLAKGKKGDKNEALKFAHEALQFSPSHTEAARLISELKEKKPVTAWHKIRKPVFALFFITIVAFVGYKYQARLRSKIDHLKEVFQPHKGAKFVLHDIYFESGSTVLHNAQSEKELKRLVVFLKKHSQLKGEVAGHTDNTGLAAVNLQISTKRAQAVYQYLIKNGVSMAQLTYRGYGSTQPKFPNNNPINRRKNRRIEFKILDVKK